MNENVKKMVENKLGRKLTEKELEKLEGLKQTADTCLDETKEIFEELSKKYDGSTMMMALGLVVAETIRKTPSLHFNAVKDWCDIILGGTIAARKEDDPERKRNPH